MRRVGAFAFVALSLLATAALAADGRRPDLEVARLTGVPAKLTTGAHFTVGTEVKNRGGASATAATVRFLMTRPGARVRIGGRRVPPLPPGSRSRRATTLRASVRPGTWRLVACVRDHCRTAKRATRVTRPLHRPMVLTSPPDGALLARRRPTFAGSADPADPVKVVVRRGGDTVATLTATPGSGGRWSAAPADPLADGSYAARARQGGRSSAAHDFTIDATAPKVAIAHPADGATTDLMAFDGKAGQGGPVRVRLDGVDVASQRNGGRWTALARPVGPGSHTVTATQRDAAGNVGRAAATFTAPVNLLAAGDIAACDSTGDEATAAVVAQRSGTIAALGDNAYDSPGAPDPYPDCFEPSWGALRPRIMPTPGNHEYEDSFGAADYFAYFGAAAGSPDKGYYSYDLGSWHVIVLNTNDDCSPSQVSCSAVSAQVTWLRTDLAAHAAARCTLAYFHHPRFSSYLGEDAKVGPLWDALYQGGADLVLNGHAHNYERYAPQDPDGAVDPARGLTEIVAGTGGRSHHSFFPTVDANSVVRDDDTYGILDVRLEPAGWSWRFLPAAGGSFTDGGSADCH